MSLLTGAAEMGLAASGAFDVNAQPDRNLYNETNDSLQTQLKLAPDVFQGQAQWAPQYNDLAMQLLSRMLQGGGGQGFLSQAQNQLAPASMAITSAQRRSDVGDMSALGPQFAQGVRMVNPGGAGLVDQMTANSQAELGSGMSPMQARLAQQSIRGAQAARGMGYGPSDIFQEVMGTMQANNDLENQKYARASQAAGQSQNMYSDPFLRVLQGAGSEPGGISTASLLSGALGTAQSQGPNLFAPLGNGFGAYTNDIYNTNYNGRAAASMASANNFAAAMGQGLQQTGQGLNQLAMAA